MPDDIDKIVDKFGEASGWQAFFFSCVFALNVTVISYVYMLHVFIIYFWIKILFKISNTLNKALKLGAITYLNVCICFFSFGTQNDWDHSL